MNTYKKFLISLFTVAFFKVFFIFFVIILITGTLEQIEFFKKIEISFFYLFFLSLLNSPSIIFEILPFIFLLSTQIFFINLIEKNELEVFKYSGLNNFTIIKIISLYTLILSFVFITIFYNTSAILKNSYLLIKNKYSEDNKYLAVITDNGLWIKDIVGNDINIINAHQVDNKFLLNVTITQFNKNFEITNIIYSEKVDISSMQWKIFEPLILKDNKEKKLDEIMLQSNFDIKKINSLFSNLSSLTMLELFELRKSYIS